MTENFILIAFLLIAILLLTRGIYETVKLDVSFTILGNANGESVSRIIFFSDLHAGFLFVPKSKIRSALTNVKADAILFGGDLTNGHKDQKRAESFLKLISEISKETDTPVFAVLGNHDKYELNAKLADYNIVLLKNKNTLLKTSSNQVLQIVGLDDIKMGTPSYEIALNSSALPFNHHNSSSSIAFSLDLSAKKVTAQIILAHNPDCFFEIPHTDHIAHTDNISLNHHISHNDNISHNHHIFNITHNTEVPRFFLSGHFHGGQIWMPFNFEFKILRREKMSSLGIYRGKFKLGGIEGYITRGLGCVMFPLRFLSSPEISILEIKI